MTPEDHKRVSDLFLEAIRLDESARKKLLDEQCADRPQIREKVEAMLAQHDTPDANLESPALGANLTPASMARDWSEQEVIHPDQIGGYRILNVLGVGGMGVVYRAQQENPRRDVALKVIRAQAVSPEALRRFEFEAQLLGRLTHSNIAQVFEAGTAPTDSGSQPYLAMELVDGEPLTQYAAQHHVKTDDRLKLMIKICQAVQHAHLRGVIHRDLKPANILVDAGGSPKVLDFGVAKVVDSDIEHHTTHTQAGQLIGTIAYMSPEQLSGDRDAVDARSDVYALGVLTYELLAGQLPYDVRGKSITDAMRLIDQSQPVALGAISKSLRGDLETIVATAIAHDSTRRYQSAGEFEEDIRRYLHNEPIVARPPSISYQLGKFAKRNKAMFAAMMISGVAIMVALGGIVWGLAQAAWQRDEALRQARTAQAINDFLNNDLLGMASPFSAPLPDLTVKQALDKAADSLEGRFEGSPSVRAAIEHTVGRTYRSLGAFTQAEKHLSQAHAIWKRQSDSQSAEALATSIHLAQIYRETARFKESENLATETVDQAKQALGANHVVTIEAMDGLGVIYTDIGKYDQAIKLFEEAMAISSSQQLNKIIVARLRSHLANAYKWTGNLDKAEPLDHQQLEFCRAQWGEDHPSTAKAMNNIATLYMRQGRFDDARKMLTIAVRIAQEALGETHPDTQIFMSNLGTALMNLREYAQAAKLLEAVFAASQDQIGADHVDTLTTAMSLAVAYRYLQRYEDARSLLKDTFARYKKTLGEANAQTLNALSYLALTHMDLKEIDAAERLMKESIQLHAKLLGKKNSGTLHAMNDLAKLYVDTDRAEQAQPLYDEILANDFDDMPNGSIVKAVFLTGAGRCLTALERYGEAETLLSEAHTTLANSQWSDSPYARDTLEGLVKLFEANRKSDEKESYKALLDQLDAEQE